MTGKIIENYKIIKLLGKGGMGTVYLAEDIMLGRQVAIKMLHPELLYKKEVLERFKAEAKILAKLNHPNIAILYNLIESDGNYYMVMEYVDGISLESMLRQQGAIAAGKAIDIIAQALEGIQHAHNRHIIHRDLKPANIMVNKENIVKVMDFGIARALGSARMTRAGSVVGTLEYMSPEQIRGKEGDERSDIYAMGIVLYELLTGNVPFKSKSDYDLMTKKLNEKPPALRTFWHEVPKSLEKVVMKALNKDPDLRYQSAGQFKQALLQCKPDIEKSTVPATGMASKIKNPLTGIDAAKIKPLFKNFDISNKKLINGLLLLVFAVIVGSGAYFLRQKRLEKIRMEKNKIQYASGTPSASSNEMETGDIPPSTPQNTTFSPPADLETPSDINPKEREKDKEQGKDKGKNKEKETKKKKRKKEKTNTKTSPGNKEKKNKTEKKKQDNSNNENNTNDNTANAGTGGKSGTVNENTDHTGNTTKDNEGEKTEDTVKKEKKATKTREYNAYIKKNTPIVIALPMEISSNDESLQGQTIPMYVDMPVTENGIDIIPQGSKVYCTVNKIKRGRGSKRGVIEIKAKYVVAPDGTQIPLKNGIFRIVGNRGENVYFKKGQKFKVKVAKNKSFIVKY